MLQEWLSTQPAVATVSPDVQCEAEIYHQDNVYGLYSCCGIMLHCTVLIIFTQGWNCRGGGWGLNPLVHVYRRSFLSENRP